MDHLRRLGNSISLSIQPDEEGFTGRECPNSACEGYFKIMFGTGLKGENLPCHCPYCGHMSSHDEFWTKEQIEYAKSVALRRITDAIHRDLKKLEFEIKPKGAFGIGMSMKLKPGRPHPIRWYREKALEKHIECSDCTLKYAVFGVFAFCPDCSQHNSLQILYKNLELVSKILDMAATAEAEMAGRLIENALEDCVSAFDGFGREICRVHAKAATDPAEVEKVSFQSLDGAKQRVSALFNLDIAAGLTGDEWNAAVRAFQKRHILSHKLGVVDAEYVRKSGDTQAVVGRKVVIDANEVRALSQTIGKLGEFLFDAMGRIG
jgi:hypothetical protein